MSNIVRSAERLAALSMLSALILTAQSADIWRSGGWTVQAPSAGNCGSPPVLTVKGPGSIFDPPSATALASLERALPAALANVCPGAREVVLASGRTRRLIKVAQSPISVPVTEASSTATAPPVSTAQRSRSDPPADSAQTPVTAPQPARATTPAPVLGARSNLPSLSSAHGNEDKCEVLFNWLESSKAEGNSAGNRGYRMPAEMLRIFRDEPMTAVFGMAYDRMENRWRLEQHEKVISHCLGLAPQTHARNVPFAGVRSKSQTMRQYSQEFAQYRQLLDESFLGKPGPFEPSAISRYVQQVREQSAWANQAMSSAAAAPPTRASFDQLAAQRQTAPRQLSALSSGEKSQVENYLSRRQTEMAPVIAEDWLRTANGTGKTIAAAKLLHKSHDDMAAVVRMLDGQTKAAWDEKYNRLIESLIAEPLHADVAKLNGVPSTLPGILQLSAQRAGFDGAFGDFRGIPAVDAARDEYARASTRILTGALPAWRQQVDRVPLEAPTVAAKHQEFESLFPGKEDRSVSLFTQFEAPLLAKEDQLRTLIAANLQKEQERGGPPASAGVSQPGNGGVQVGPLNSSSFTARGLVNERALMKLFAGDFVGIDFDRDDLKFKGIFQQYLESYGRHCDEYLIPPNRVPIMTAVCTSEWVNSRTGISTGRCANYDNKPTGLFAKRALSDAMGMLDRQRAADALREVSRRMTEWIQVAQNDPIGGMMNMVGDVQAVKSDMVQMNGCRSPSVQRFEDNLRLFALNRPPIRLDGKSAVTAVTVPIPGIPFKDQNYTKLIEALVVDDATKWGGFAEFVQGSISDATVSSRDQMGRPARIMAPYAWNNILGKRRATVTLTFSEGLPECLYYSDTPSVCHAASRKIVAAYAAGAYQQ
jgi:hypothetical protein